MSTVQVYHDPATELYQAFIQQFTSCGIRWFFAMREEFFKTPPENQIRLQHLLPLQTHSRVMLSLSQENINQLLEKLAKEGRRKSLEDLATLRDVINRYFIVFEDDVVHFKIFVRQQLVVEYQGKISEFTVLAKDFIRPELKLQTGDLFEIQAQLLSAGPQRKSEEKRALFGNFSQLAEKILDLEALEIALAKLSDERLRERLQLFGTVVPAEEAPQAYLLDLTRPTFATTNLVALEDVYRELGSEIYTNAEVLAFMDGPRQQELYKMHEWLKENQGLFAQNLKD